MKGENFVQALLFHPTVAMASGEQLAQVGSQQTNQQSREGTSWAPNGHGRGQLAQPRPLHAHAPVEVTERKSIEGITTLEPATNNSKS